MFLTKYASTLYPQKSTKMQLLYILPKVFDKYISIFLKKYCFKATSYSNPISHFTLHFLEKMQIFKKSLIAESLLLRLAVTFSGNLYIKRAIY